MSNYLDRLKEIESGKKFNHSLITEVSKVPKAPSDTFDTSNPVEIKKNSDIASNESLQIEMIRAWLFKINEPEPDHCLVLDRCKKNPQVLKYYLKHAKGEFLL